MARLSVVKNMVEVFVDIILRRKKLNTRKTQQESFSKSLSTHQLIHLGIGATLGAGTYVVTGQVAANIAGPAVVISFTIAAITSILSGLCYAEFGARVPNTTGSAYTYSYVTVGEIWAFFIGWNLILEYMIGTAADAAALSGAFDYAIGYRVRNWTLENVGTFHTAFLGDYPDFLAFIFTLIVTIVLAFGVQESARFTVFFNFFNIAVVLFIVITGSIYVDVKNWTKGGGFFPYGASGVLSGAATCFYAFVGFDIIATTGEEAKNPSKSIPVAIVVSLVIIFVCYFGVSTILTLMVPYNELDKLSPIPDAFLKRGISWANYVVSIGAICGMSSSLMGSQFPMPRIIYAMADDGLLFKLFTQINKRTKVPVNATVYPGILTAVFALLFNLKELVEMMSIGTLLAYTLVSLCILILRYQPDSFYNSEYAMQLLTDSDNQKDGDYTDERKGAKSDLTLFENSINELIEENVRTYSEERSSTSFLDQEVDKNGEKLKQYSILREETAPGTDECGPTLKTGRIVTGTCLSMFVWFFGFNGTLIFAYEQLLAMETWAIFLIIFFGSLIISSFGIICSMPKSKATFGFMAPLVPGLPIVAIYANTFLMLKLSRTTWIRFAVWMVVGILLYAFYGARNSKANQKEESIDDSLHEI